METKQIEQKQDRIAVDLHMHTTYSDGSSTPQQIVKDNALLGLDAIVISDHDTTSAYQEAKLEADKWGIELITGVEITTPIYHILGYNFDITNQKLQELLEYSREMQYKLTEARAKALNKYGIPITIEKIVEYSPNARLGKTNVVYAMVQDAECRNYFKEKGLVSKSAEHIFRMYVGKHGIAKDLPVKIKQVSVKGAVEAIHSAGGIAIVAHPFKEVNDLEKDMKNLIDDKIDGLEIQPNYREANAPFEEYAKTKNMILTYGSDFHGICFPERLYLGRKNNMIQKFW